MPTYRGHKKENCTKEICNNDHKKTGRKLWHQANKCPIEDIACKIDFKKLEISLFGFKTHNKE
jgi:hypothetical protein